MLAAILVPVGSQATLIALPCGTGISLFSPAEVANIILPLAVPVANSPALTLILYLLSSDTTGSYGYENQSPVCLVLISCMLRGCYVLRMSQSYAKLVFRETMQCD